MGVVVCKCCCRSGSMTCRTGLGFFMWTPAGEVRCTPSRVPAVVVPKADENPPYGPTLNWPALSSRTQAKKVVVRSAPSSTEPMPATARSLSFFFFSCRIFFCFLCGQFLVLGFLPESNCPLGWAIITTAQCCLVLLLLLLQAPFPPVGVEK